MKSDKIDAGMTMVNASIINTVRSTEKTSSKNPISENGTTQNLSDKKPIGTMIRQICINMNAPSNRVKDGFMFQSRIVTSEISSQA
jgi:hypothetical protein